MNQTALRQGVTVIADVDPDDRYADPEKLDFTDATAEEVQQGYDSIYRLVIKRGEKVIASFNMNSVQSWYNWQ